MDIKQHSWYFRNALVRASYKGLHVSPTTKYAALFLRNVILGENNELRNRDMLVGATLAQNKVESVNTDTSKSQIETLDYALEELAVLRTIENKPQITQTEIAKIIKKSASTIKRITSILVKKPSLYEKMDSVTVGGK